MLAVSYATARALAVCACCCKWDAAAVALAIMGACLSGCVQTDCNVKNFDCYKLLACDSLCWSQKQHLQMQLHVQATCSAEFVWQQCNSPPWCVDLTTCSLLHFRWTSNNTASPASEGILTPVRHFGDLDVVPAADSTSSTGKIQEKYQTPTPARNAAAGVEQRILEKIASVCSPGPGVRLHAGKRSITLSHAGSDDLAPRQ